MQSRQGIKLGLNFFLLISKKAHTPKIKKQRQKMELIHQIPYKKTHEKIEEMGWGSQVGEMHVQRAKWWASSLHDG